MFANKWVYVSVSAPGVTTVAHAQALSQIAADLVGRRPKGIILADSCNSGGRDFLSYVHAYYCATPERERPKVVLVVSRDAADVSILRNFLSVPGFPVEIVYSGQRRDKPGYEVNADGLGLSQARSRAKDDGTQAAVLYVSLGAASNSLRTGLGAMLHTAVSNWEDVTAWKVSMDAPRDVTMHPKEPREWPTWAAEPREASTSGAALSLVPAAAT